MEKLLNQISIQTSRGGVFKRPCRSFFKSLALACLLILTPLLVLSCGGSASGGSPTYYSVIFDTDGGSEIPSQSVEAGGKAAEPAQAPSKDNCSFEGWYTDKTFNTRFNFEKEITRPVTIYARWQTASGFYLVSFVTNIDVTIESQTVQEGKKAAAPQEPLEREKYKFAGWYTDQTFNSPFDFESPVDSNLTLYAKWNALFTVTFSGADLPKQIIEEGNKVTKPQNPTDSSGRLFGGWYINEECTIAFDFNSTILEDKTLYAKWKNGWTVTFSGANDIPAQTVKNNAKATRPSKPANQGKLTFDDWYEDAAFTTKFNFDKPITSDTKIYAKWLSTYTVSFDSNGGSEVNSVSALQGAKVAKPADPTRSNRSFVGWYTDRECTKAFDFATMTVTRDFILYAKWGIPEGVENPLSIQIVKAELEVEYELTSLVGGQKIEFTSKCGEGDWYIDGAKVATAASSYEALSNFYSQSARIVTVEFHKTINGIEYTWQALLSL